MSSNEIKNRSERELESRELPTSFQKMLERIQQFSRDLRRNERNNGDKHAKNIKLQTAALHQFRSQFSMLRKEIKTGPKIALKKVEDIRLPGPGANFLQGCMSLTKRRLKMLPLAYSCMAAVL